MNNSLKIGIVAGLIAGIVAGIVVIIVSLFLFTLDLPYYFIHAMPDAPITKVAVAYMVVNIIWGAILGAIYSMAYEFVPGKAALKGFYYGMIVLLITNIRDGTFLIPLGYIVFLPIISWYLIGFFQAVTYGTLLGILYKFLLDRYYVTKRKQKIIKYDVGSGIHTGAIAGAIGGVVAFIFRVMGPMIGIFPITGAPMIPTPYVAIASWHIILNMFWGAILGAIYSKAYILVPGKGIMKGLCYGLLFFLVASFRTTTYLLGWGDVPSAWSWSFIGFFQAIAFGLVLGYLYRKPIGISNIKKEKTQITIVLNCNHCGASIDKNSKICKICGKKQ